MVRPPSKNFCFCLFYVPFSWSSTDCAPQLHPSVCMRRDFRAVSEAASLRIDNRSLPILHTRSHCMPGGEKSGRGARGTPTELARGGGHSAVVDLLENALAVPASASAAAAAAAVAPKENGGGGGGGIPDTITVSGAITCHGGWPNDSWVRDGVANGRPQWQRRGNGVDKIKWDGARWALNGVSLPQPGRPS